MVQRAIWRAGRLAPLALAVGLALFGNQGAPAGAGGAYKADPFVIADRRNDQVRPRISGDWVVWKDYRSLSLRAVDDSPNAEIWARDLTTDAELQVSPSKDAGDPAISGNLVVWTEGRERRTEIRGTFLGSGEIFRLADSPFRQEHPDVDLPIIVWQDHRNGNWDIFAYHLDEEREWPIVERDDDQIYPAVSGRTIVWEDWRNKSGPDIYGVDLDSEKTFRLTNNRDGYAPAISGRWVVWMGIADPGIFARHLDDGKTRRLSSGPGRKSQPAISGDLVVWTDERTTDRDVYGYDLVEGVEFPVVVRDDSPQDDPHIDGTRIVWSDGRGPNRDIVGARLGLPRELKTEPDEPVAASPPPAATAQPAPASQPTPTAASTRLRVSGTDSAGLNLRARPSATAAVLKTIPDGTILVASGGPEPHEGQSWYQVRDPAGATGWVAADFVTPL